MPDVGNFGTLVSLITLGVSWMIIQPLRQSIEGLKESVDDLKEEVKISRRDLAELRERVTKCEAATSSAHKRLDTLEHNK